jgi:hypothetical protein
MLLLLLLLLPPPPLLVLPWGMVARASKGRSSVQASLHGGVQQRQQPVH